MISKKQSLLLRTTKKYHAKVNRELDKEFRYANFYSFLGQSGVDVPLILRAQRIPGQEDYVDI